jgi:hypothetical protein
MTAVPSTVLYYPQGDDATVYEVTEYPYRYPEAQGVRVPQSLMRPSRISVGLLVRRMSHTTTGGAKARPPWAVDWAPSLLAL